MVWLKGEEPASSRVRILLDAGGSRAYKPLMNIVNVGEVFYLSVKARDLVYGQWILKNLQPRIVTIPASDELVMRAAALKARHAISYADAFAAATAMERNAALVTGDRELKRMADVEASLKLDWIGL